MSVTVVIGKRHLLAGLSLIVLTALIGIALVVPAVSDATTTYTRLASCAGLDFYPTDSRTEYDNYGPLRVWREGDTDNQGTGVFRCDPGLPNGAVVTKIQFTAEQTTGLGVSDCALVRSGLTATAATTVQTLAQVIFSQSATGTFRLSNSSIANATIDNANWGYWLECQFGWDWAWSQTPGGGLYGADVIYTITAAKG